jgi:N-acetylneuraminate synthase
MSVPAMTNPTADHVRVIAEAGVNHNGSLANALKLVDVAAEAGADVVKFQTFKADKLATATAQKAEYQTANTGQAGDQLTMLRALELSADDHAALIARCRKHGLAFMSTAFDADSLAFLGTLDMPAVKIPSGDITAADLLLRAARLRRPMIVSTGMATLEDIESALGVIAFGLTREGEPTGRADFTAAYRSAEGREALRRHITLLHCVTEYPAPPDAINLRAMDTMAEGFGLPVGYSDHTLGIEVALAAVARGASVIEKHFTLDRTMPGPDHAASLEPAELKSMVAAIRTIERALGSPAKGPGPEELKNLPVARRSLVAARPIRRGETITREMLAEKRPGTGVSPMEAWSLLGRPAARDYLADEMIEP